MIILDRTDEKRSHLVFRNSTDHKTHAENLWLKSLAEISTGLPHESLQYAQMRHLMGAIYEAIKCGKLFGMHIQGESTKCKGP